MAALGRGETKGKETMVGERWSDGETEVGERRELGGAWVFPEVVGGHGGAP